MVQKIVVAEPRTAVQNDKRSDAGFEVAEHSIVCLEGLAGGGIHERGEAII